MARLARVVLPGVAHHVTQRGNRRLPVFFCDDDRILYLQLLRKGLARADMACIAWCLMDNHVHLILLPQTADGLRAGLAEAHRRYTRHVNVREGWRGHLFQARFASYPMSDAHLLAAIRYVENNPVAAGLVPRAEAWRWSSARSHVAGRPAQDDLLTDLAALGLRVRNWRAMLRHGWEAGDVEAEGAHVAEAIETRLRTGRPLGADAWIAAMESAQGRPLAPKKRGPKPRADPPQQFSILSPEFLVYCPRNSCPRNSVAMARMNGNPAIARGNNIYTLETRFSAYSSLGPTFFSEIVHTAQYQSGDLNGALYAGASILGFWPQGMHTTTTSKHLPIPSVMS